MRFLDLLLSPGEKPSKKPAPVNEMRFSALALKLFSTPCRGSMKVQQGASPLVKFAGTLWRFRVYGSQSFRFVDGQMVKILGRQGNCLLIEPELGND
jgi:hypothetical protein